MHVVSLFAAGLAAPPHSMGGGMIETRSRRRFEGVPAASLAAALKKGRAANIKHYAQYGLRDCAVPH